MYYNTILLLRVSSTQSGSVHTIGMYALTISMSQIEYHACVSFPK